MKSFDRPFIACDSFDDLQLVTREWRYQRSYCFRLLPNITFSLSYFSFSFSGYSESHRGYPLIASTISVSLSLVPFHDKRARVFALFPFFFTSFSRFSVPHPSISCCVDFLQAVVGDDTRRLPGEMYHNMSVMDTFSR